MSVMSTYSLSEASVLHVAKLLSAPFSWQGLRLMFLPL